LLNQPLCDREPQTRSFPHALCGVADLVEFIENRFLLSLRNTDASVDHRNFDNTALEYRFNADRSTFRSKLHRVAEQIEQDLLKADTIGVQSSQNADVTRELDGLRCALRANRA